MKKAEKKMLVSEVLTSVGKIADRPVDKKGNLDVEAFNKLPLVVYATNRLRKVGITRKWLSDNGFMVAAMVLTFKK